MSTQRRHRAWPHNVLHNASGSSLPQVEYIHREREREREERAREMCLLACRAVCTGRQCKLLGEMLVHCLLAALSSPLLQSSHPHSLSRSLLRSGSLSLSASYSPGQPPGLSLSPSPSLSVALSLLPSLSLSPSALLISVCELTKSTLASTRGLCQISVLY